MAVTLLLALALAAAQPPPPLATLMNPNGAKLGMSLSDWKALPFREIDPTASGLQQLCSDQAQARTAGLALINTAQPDVVDCTYVDHLSHLWWPEDASLTKRFRARSLRFEFSHGRLAHMGYRTSVDAYNMLTARLDSEFGQPVSTRASSVSLSIATRPGVRQTWRGQGMVVTLVDPVPGTAMLALDFSTDGRDQTSPDGLTPARPPASGAPKTG